MRLIKLTGRHPHNCEPDMETLMRGFITPPSVHYVRTHGNTPKLRWDTHK
jgi:nitrate reductase (NAD(P)H)